MGYDVHQFTPWHYRVNKEERELEIDVYPTRRKYVTRTDDQISTANSYTDLLELIETLLP